MNERTSQIIPFEATFVTGIRLFRHDYFRLFTFIK